MTRGQLASHIRDQLRSSGGQYMPDDERQYILKEAVVVTSRDNAKNIVSELCKHFDMLASDNEAMVARRYSIEVNRRRARMWREAIKEMQALEWTE